MRTCIIDWETTHPHRKLFGWQLILPLVSPMTWETNHLLTGSTLNSPRDLLMMHRPLQSISWLSFRSRVHALHPVGVSPSVLPAKSEVAGLPQNRGWSAMSYTHTLSCYLIHCGLYLCDSQGLQVTRNTSPSFPGLGYTPSCCSDPTTSVSHVCFLALLLYFNIHSFIHLTNTASVSTMCRHPARC